MILAKPSGEPAACPFTAVMTAPPVMPAEAAGLPQIVPSIRVPELTGPAALSRSRRSISAESASTSLRRDCGVDWLMSGHPPSHSAREMIQASG
jgi:hypothetical protein